MLLVGSLILGAVMSQIGSSGGENSFTTTQSPEPAMAITETERVVELSPVPSRGKLEFVSPSPSIAPIPTKTPIPTPKDTPTPIANSNGTWSCNCRKTCDEMSSCAEAQYQLNVCGCSRRDADYDGIACDANCQ